MKNPALTAYATKLAVDVGTVLTATTTAESSTDLLLLANEIDGLMAHALRLKNLVDAEFGKANEREIGRRKSPTAPVLPNGPTAKALRERANR